MKYSKLKEYLDDPQLAKKIPVSKEEFFALGPEPLILVYIIIGQAIREKTTIIEVTADETVMRNKFNGPVINRESTPKDLRQLFELIRKRDAIIESSLNLIGASNESLIYEIV